MTDASAKPMATRREPRRELRPVGRPDQTMDSPKSESRGIGLRPRAQKTRGSIKCESSAFPCKGPGKAEPRPVTGGDAALSSEEGERRSGVSDRERAHFAREGRRV